MPSDWYCRISGKTYGPLNDQQLQKAARTGRLSPTDAVKKGTVGKWVRAQAVKGLFSEPPAKVRHAHDEQQRVAGTESHDRLRSGGATNEPVTQSGVSRPADHTSAEAEPTPSNTSRALQGQPAGATPQRAARASTPSALTRFIVQLAVVLVIITVLILAVVFKVWGPYWKAQKLASDKPFTDPANTFRVAAPFAFENVPSIDERRMQLEDGSDATLTAYSAASREYPFVRFGVAIIQTERRLVPANPGAIEEREAAVFPNEDAVANSVIDGSFTAIKAQEKSRQTFMRGDRHVMRASALAWPDKETGQTGVAMEVHVRPRAVYYLQAFVKRSTDDVPCVDQFFESFEIIGDAN